MADQEKMKPKDYNLNLRLRLEKLREKLISQKLDAVLIYGVENRHYLTLWHGDVESGFILVTPLKAFIITDSRYSEHANKETTGFEVLEITQGTITGVLEKLCQELKIKRIGFESHHLSVFLFQRIKKSLRSVRLVPMVNLVENLRMQKDENEIAKLTIVARITSEAFVYILKTIRAGMSEQDVAWELTNFMRQKGAEKNAWEPLIVASGENSSMAHYVPGTRKIKKGDMVLLDFGCVFQGYCSDMTRMLFMGPPDAKKRKVYKEVLEAQELGISLVKSGRRTSLIDEKVRSSLEETTEFSYRHGLGHGVGLQVHELPSLSIGVKQKLLFGNVITVEPGIYEPGWGGVRIEDMVLVTKKGYEVLTKAPKELEKVIVS